METRSEEAIHKLRLKLNDTYQNNNNSSTFNLRNTPSNNYSNNNNNQNVGSGIISYSANRQTFSSNRKPPQNLPPLQNNFPNQKSYNYDYYNNNEYIDSNNQINNYSNKNFDYEYVLNDDPFKPTNGRYVYKNNSSSKLSENNSQFNNYTTNNSKNYNINAGINYQAINNLKNDNGNNFNRDRRTMNINYNSINQNSFDALESRRRLLDELSSSNIIRNVNTPNNRTSYYANNNEANSRIGQYPNNQNLQTNLYDEESTFTSNNMDDLIDVMAKRRLAIKKLETEMNRQYSRINNFTRQNSSIRGSQANLRYIDPYNSYERQSRLQESSSINYDPTSSVYKVRTPSILSGFRLNDNLISPNKLISNLEYPSETNREIYSTYLVDSIKPHYSARKLVSSKSNSNDPLLQIQSLQQPAILESPNELDLLDSLDNNLESFFNTKSINQSKQSFSPPPSASDNNKKFINDNQKIKLKSSAILVSRQTSPILILNSSNDPIKKTVNIIERATLSREMTNLNIERVISPSYSMNNEKNEDRKKSLEMLVRNNSNDFDKNKENEFPSTSRTYITYPRNNNDFDIPTNEIETPGRKYSPLPKINSTIESQKLKTNTINESSLISISVPRNGIAAKLPRLFDIRKTFWGAATLIRFLMRIQLKGKENRKKNPDRSGSASIFRIRLLEIMTALHRVYLEPEGPIYSSLIAFVKNPNDMNMIFDIKSPIFDECVNIICQNVEEIVQRITEFMPKEGIIGSSTSKSAMLSLISEGNKFPDNYFWDIEKERLVFEQETGRIKKITRERAILLLMSTTISRGLITTLLVKPIKFRFLRGELDMITKNNLKILATIFCYLVRLVNDNTNKFMNFPWEWQASLINDNKMKFFYEIPQVEQMLSRCKNLFVNWTSEYINKLDETAGLKR